MTDINPFINPIANYTTVDQVPTDTSTIFNEDSIAPGVYINDVWTIDYVWNHHKVQIPIASDSATKCSIAVLAQPTVKRVVKYTMERLAPLGVYPMVPNPYSPDSNEVLEGGTIVLWNLRAEADGLNIAWKIEGHYTYLIIDYTKVKYMAGASPTIDIQYSQTELPASVFANGMTAPLSGGAPVIFPIKG